MWFKFGVNQQVKIHIASNFEKCYGNGNCKILRLKLMWCKQKMSSFIRWKMNFTVLASALIQLYIFKYTPHICIHTLCLYEIFCLHISLHISLHTSYLIAHPNSQNT